MQNKGVIRLFAILLALVCLFQLSYTYVTYKVKKDAKEYAQGDQKKERAYLDSISSEIVYNIGVAQFTFRECQERQINLGLDLQGGMNVILEVSVEDIIIALSNHSNDTTFRKAIVRAKEMQKSGNEDFVTLFGRAFNEVDPNARLSVIFSTVELKDRVNYNSTNDEVLSVIKTETKGAIDNAFEIISARIDKFGVAQPKIQQLETQGRILVELPGVDEQARVRKILQSTASLEFWETYNISELYDGMIQANEIIKNKQIAEKSLSNQNSQDNNPEAAISQNEDTTDSDEDASLALLDRMLDSSGVTDTTGMSDLQQFQQNYPFFAVLQPNVSQDYVPKGSIIGHSLARDTSKVNAYLNLPQIKSLFPRNIKFLWSAFGIKDPKTNKLTDTYELHAIKVSGRDGQAALSGDVVTSAMADFDQNSAQTEVVMNMNAEGTKTWARLTKENIEKSIAVVLDNYVYSSPVVEVEINTGRSRITGSFDINEATDLANMLKSGKLPAPARIIQDSVVGPTLGKQSINAGFASFIIAFFLVLFYMMFYYNRAGYVADIALLCNLFFLIGIMASLGAALTLPGIAGIVLTMGMAVDANVIIYERVREELAAGKGLKLAISDGFKNAYSAIIDGNVTTLLTGVILYLFGTGPIKGFATTLVIGILTSLFCGIFITRLIFIRMMDKNKEIKFSIKLTEGVLRNARFDFIGSRKIFYALSGIVIAVGLFSLVTKGLSLGVDFTGGRSYIIRFNNLQSVNTVDIQKQLKGVFDGAPEVVTFGDPNQVRVTTRYKIDQTSADIEEEVEGLLYDGLKATAGDVDKETFIKNNIQSSMNVGPTIADDIKKDAVKSMIFALIIMFLYILIRFKNWQFGMGATVALAHDAFITLGLFSIFYGIFPFSLEIDQSFIAAILTVIGYSINDTVIIFDRIREYVALYPKRETKEVMNLAINSTLGRTMNTSLTTIFTLVAIFIFGGDVIRGFIFALTVGIVVGTYSSVFIASALVFDSIKKQTGHHEISGIRRS